MQNQLDSSAQAAAARAPQIKLDAVGKSYGGTSVLRDISLTVEPGEIHGLLGENGAGKSTLLKILGGAIASDAGTVSFDGVPARLGTPRDAIELGVSLIAQELALVPALSVAENVFLGREPRTGGFIDRRELRRRFVALADRVGFDLDPDRAVRTLRVADQQKVEILRALARGASLIIMDEPTAALSGTDTELLHGIVRQLAASGHSVLLISHFLSEVLELCDTITVLRDGKHIRTAPAASETESARKRTGAPASVSTP